MALLRRTSSLLTGLLLLGAAAEAQTLRMALEGGGPILGLGSLSRAEEIHVNEGGSWYTLVTANVLTRPDETPRDGGVLRNGFVTIREGATLASPAMATVVGIDDFDATPRGDIAMALSLEGVPIPGQDDAGLYLNSVPLLSRGRPVEIEGYGPTTLWRDFLDVVATPDGNLLVLVSLDDPDVGGPSNRGMVRVFLDENGELVGKELVMKDSQQLANVPRPIRSVGTGPHAFDGDAHGNVLVRLFQSGGQAADGLVAYNETQLARENTFSIIPDRRYNDLSTSRVDLNNRDELVFTATLQGDGTTNELILRGRALSREEVELEIFVQKGDTLPSL